MKDVFDSFISRLYMVEERISELEDLLIDTSKTDGKQNRIYKNCETTTKGVTYM